MNKSYLQADEGATLNGTESVQSSVTRKHRSCPFGGRIFVVITLVLVATTLLFAENRTLSEMSLEDLMDIEVTSVSRKAEKLSEAPAAIYVMTGEEILRSGARTIPDALRMVPGVQVANIDASTWAVSARGFNANFANKLLVLIDGRTVYSPLFSGVWWDAQNIMMEHIDRIEVIRGPGATMWGANAVNGVINIITKESQESAGTLVTVGAGTEERGAGSVSLSRPLGEHSHLRIHGNYFDRENFGNVGALSANDSWDRLRGGFRFDWKPNESVSYTMQGDAHGGTANGSYYLPTLEEPYLEQIQASSDLIGASVLARAERTINPKNSVSFQSYLEYSEREEINIDAAMRAVDFELQHSYKPSARMSMLWGGGYRHYSDRFYSNLYVDIRPAKQDYDLYNGFLQFDIGVVPNKLNVIAGSKIEHNAFTSWEIQPSVRLLLKPSHNQTIWGAVSRAVRTPSTAERTGNLFVGVVPPLSLGNPEPIPVKVSVVSTQATSTESVLTYEAGFRWQANERVNMDLAAFYGRYSDLLFGEFGQPTVDENYPAYIIQPIYLHNQDQAENYGLEFASYFRLFDDLDTRITYSYINTNDDRVYDRATESTALSSFETEPPSHQVSVLTLAQLGSRISIGTRFRYVDAIRSSVSYDSYFTADGTLNVTLTRGIQLSLSGEDFEKEHVEYSSELGRLSSSVQRRFFAQLKLEM